MTRAYAWLLRMYPRGEWALFSAEMLATFKEAAREHRGRGWAVYARFALREILGLFAGAVRAWFAAWREAPALDLTKMRPPGVPRQAYAEALDEVIEAQRSVESNLARMQHAIYRHEFVKARFYSEQDRKARELLRLLRKRHGIAE